MSFVEFTDIEGNKQGLRASAIIGWMEVSGDKNAKTFERTVQLALGGGIVLKLRMKEFEDNVKPILLKND